MRQFTSEFLCAFVLILLFIYPTQGYPAKSQQDKVKDFIKASQYEQAYKELLVLEKNQLDELAKNSKSTKETKDAKDAKDAKEAKDVKENDPKNSAADSKELASAKPPENSLLKTIHWAKGYLNISLSHMDLAKNELSPLLDDSVWGGEASFYMAQILAQENKNEEAFKLILQAEKKEISKKLKMDIFLEKSKLLVKMKKWRDANVYLQKISRPMKTDYRYSDWLKLYVKTNFELRNYTQSCKYLKKHYVRFPNDLIWPGKAPLMEKIDVLGSSVSCDVDDELFSNRRRQLVSLGMTEQLQSEIQMWIQKNHLDAFEKDRLAVSQLVNEGNFIQALDLYLKYYEEKKYDFNYLSTLANLATRAGENPLAIGSLLRAYDHAGRPAKAKQILFQAALLSYQVEDYDGSQILFEKILKKYARSKFAYEAKWYIAWIQYLKGHYLEAANLMMDIRKGNSQERVKYWMAMSFLKSGNFQEAKNLFSHIVNNSEGISFYSVAAKQRLDPLLLSPDIVSKENAKRTPTSLFTEDFFGKNNGIKNDKDEKEDKDDKVDKEDKDEDSAIAGDEGESFSSDDSFDLVSQSSHIQERLEKAHYLRVIGFEEQAQEEFKELEKVFLRGEKGKKLLEEYQQFQDYNRLSQLSYDIWQKQGAPNLNATTRFIWESMYPQAYKDDVIKWGQEFSIPPAFLWGIMKAESQYRPWVISPVGALGLMQVMPFTGKKVADMMGEKEFTPNKLKVPSMAIKIGAKYMEKLSRNFQSTIPLMAAAYNAGPHRVLNWVYHFGYLDMDEWVEHIPFTETRNYVKRVVSNYFSYQTLYGDKIGSQNLTLTRTIPFQVTEPTPMYETWD